jgi:hypothetical protein
MTDKCHIFRFIFQPCSWTRLSICALTDLDIRARLTNTNPGRMDLPSPKAPSKPMNYLLVQNGARSNKLLLMGHVKGETNAHIFREVRP